jgi:hypothetical protein
MVEGMDPFQFREAVMARLNQILGKGEAWVLIAKTPKGEIPVGLVLAVIAGSYCEPYAFWFPEASPRNKLETALRFLIDLKQKYRLILWIRPKDWTFFGHLCKYGVVRTVGKYRGYFPDGTDALLFQGVN